MTERCNGSYALKKNDLLHTKYNFKLFHFMVILHFLFYFISRLFFILRDNKYEINKIQLNYPQPRSQVHSPTRLSLAVRAGRRGAWERG